jgi:hypothetical protein
MKFIQISLKLSNFLKKFAERAKPSLKIPTKSFFIGSLTVLEMDNGSVSPVKHDYKLNF